MTLSAIPMFFVAGCAATALAVARAPAGRALSWVLALECVLLTALLAVMLTTAPVEREALGCYHCGADRDRGDGRAERGGATVHEGRPSTNVMTTNTTQLAIDATIVLLALCGCGDAAQAREVAREARRLLAANGGLYPRHSDGRVVLQAVGAAGARRADRGGLRAARVDAAQPFAFSELNISKASFGFMFLCTTAATAAIIAFGASDWKMLRPMSTPDAPCCTAL